VQLCIALLEKLIDLHQIDYRAHGLEWIGKGEGYVRRQVERWTDRFHKDRRENNPVGESVAAWLSQNTPLSETGVSLIHNDFRFDNVVLDPADPLKIIGVLDWEMATLGDPLMDLGAALAYWTEPNDAEPCQLIRVQPTTAPGMFTRSQAIKYNLDRTDRQTGLDKFYPIFGYFRLSVILRQFYSWSLQGKKKNPRFADFGGAARHLEELCLGLIETSRCRGSLSGDRGGYRSPDQHA